MNELTDKVDARRVRGDVTRRRIVTLAADLASVRGLDDVSVAELAAELSLSKSGVHALFGTKEELELAVIAAASTRFIDAVVEPTLVIAPRPGRDRLHALVEHWLGYVERREFPGGCFVTHCLTEFAARPGAVRDALLQLKHEWLALLEQQLSAAVSEDGLTLADPDPAQTAFEIDALLVAGNNWCLLGEENALSRARHGVDKLIGQQ